MSEPLELPVRSDLAAYEFALTLEQRDYVFAFEYNDRRELWVMNISDSFGDPILNGVNMQQGFNLLNNIDTSQMPLGQFVIVDETGHERDPDAETFGNEVKLIYVPSE